MKRVLSALGAAGVLAVAPIARAVEGPADVETDHVDAADDGGPRAAGILVHPVAIAAGWLGAEVDASCGDHATLTVEGDARWVRGLHGYRALLGFALFPQRFSFHGVYVHPTFEWDRVTAVAAAANALGGGVTVGYAWTWAVGASVRLGGGIAYAKEIVTDGQAAFALEGLRPEVDADLGWVF
jgi:hypothetical protein